MLRMLIVALLGLSLIAVAFPDEPKPQWQRMLTGDDAKNAADLKKRIKELEAADKYAEAISLQEELLALRTKLQGANHWEAVNEKWAVTALKKVAALQEESRAAWRKSNHDTAATQNLLQRGQYAKVLPVWHEHLKWCRLVLGEDHPLTAECYNNIAIALDGQGKYSEGEPLLEKALEIHRKLLGEEHPATAASYTNVAYNLNAQRKYVEAGLLYRKGLDTCRNILGEEHPDTVSSYQSVADNLNDQGKYVEAGLLLQKILDMRRKVLGERHPSTAVGYDNFATNLNHQGKYAEADPLHRKALEILRKVLGEESQDTAISYDNLATNLSQQGKYAEAEPLHRKSLEILRKVLGEEHADTALSYNNVAGNLSLQGKYAEAGPLLQKALEISRKVSGEEHSYTAICYNSVAYNLMSQEKYVEAGPFLQKALDISRKVLGEEHRYTGICYNNVAVSLIAQGKYAQAELLNQKALDINRKVLGEGHPDTAVGYMNLASTLNAQGTFALALQTLQSAARSYEVARLGVATGGLERAAFGARRSPYASLSAAVIRANRSDKAWEALEADLARGLLDEMAVRRGSGLKPAEQRSHDELRSRINPINTRILALAIQSKQTDAEAKELEQLIEERKGLEKSLIKLAVEASHREVATLDQLQAALPADAAFIGWVGDWHQSSGLREFWGCVVRSGGDPHWARLPGTGPDGKWTKEDYEQHIHVDEVLTKSASASEIEALAKKVYARHLAPLRKHLVGVKRLIFAFNTTGAGIPIEIVANEYTVSYTPSGTYFARLKDRERPHGTRMLAVGDPVFPPVKEVPQPTALPPGGLLITQVVPGSNAAKARLQSGDVLIAYAGEDLNSLEQFDKLLAANAKSTSVVVKVWREGQEKMAEREVAPGRLGVALAKELAREAISARRQTDQMLAKLTRGEDFAELPGTQVEITRLARLFDAKNVTTLTRADATEQRLEEMRKGDKLKQFKYLHFATHGKANNFRSFDSALILTPPKEIPEPRANEPWLDGRLTAAEVLEYWKLDAELVTLSACESALGRQGGGDGLLGFAQAFLLAGSRSVCLTLWQVDDTATALLMDRFYRNLLGKREDGAKSMGKAAALDEAKRWLRNLSLAEVMERLSNLTSGVVRGERPAREEIKPVPVPKDAGKDYKPYAHPRYWAAFILIGDPE
jgi:tetratricopeptide (TPR) repeat protein